MTPAQMLLWQDMLKRSWHPSQWFNHDGDGEEEDKVMWVYRRVDDKFEVGYWSPQGEWTWDSVWPTKEQAAKRVHWLNGGGQ